MEDQSCEWQGVLSEEGGGDQPAREGNTGVRNAQWSLPISVNFRGLCLDVMTCKDGAMD